LSLSVFQITNLENEIVLGNRWSAVTAFDDFVNTTNNQIIGEYLIEIVLKIHCSFSLLKHNLPFCRCYWFIRRQ